MKVGERGSDIIVVTIDFAYAVHRLPRPRRLLAQHDFDAEPNGTDKPRHNHSDHGLERIALGLLDAFPALRFTVDLSHYVVAREVNLPVRNDIDAMITRILDHGWAMHGRVAGSHQVQLELSFPQHEPWFAQFRTWWAAGFRSWRERAARDATLSFTCELGPAPYAITGPDGRDQSDRWSEACLLRERILELWEPKGFQLTGS